MINKERMLNQFYELIKIPSESGDEKAVGEYLVKKLEKLGAHKIFVDKKPLEQVKANFGNIVAKFEGNIDCDPILLCAHMDTVAPGVGIKPSVKDGFVVSDGTTILGSDDKAGITMILETLSVLKEKGIDHGPIEVFFTMYEEVNLIGARYMDTSLIESKFGIICDSHGMDEVIVKAPMRKIFDFKIKGLEAHAGAEPDRGINALQVAADAINKVKFGYVEDGLTFNIGEIQGGRGRNVVMGEVVVRGEVRSHNPKKVDDYINFVVKTFEDTCKKHKIMLDGKEVVTQFEKDINLSFPTLVLNENNKICRVLKDAANHLSMKLNFVASGGGSDANFLYGFGIEAAVIGAGYYNPHSLSEKLNIDEFNKCASLLLEAVKTWSSESKKGGKNVGV